MKKCLICLIKKPYPICPKCLINPFLVERTRQILAENDDLKNLKKMYLKKMSEIRNLNTSRFWNQKFSQESNLGQQDEMTKDRVRTAFKYLPESARKIFDIGAGHGFLEELMSKNKRLEILANDISYISINNLKKSFTGTFRKESIYQMRYSPKLFDAIFLLEVLEHIPPSYSLRILGKIKTFLVRDGHLILSAPINEGLEKMTNNPSGHVRMYTEKLIEAELKIAGFRIQKIKKLYAFKRLYIWKKIFSKIQRNRWKPNNIVILAKSF